MKRMILHSDCNNFYASVECLFNPEIRDKPVAVGGNEEARHGIILAKNYHAKRFNIKTGEAIWQARLKCPDLVVVPPSFDRYLYYSKHINEIYAEYAATVEPYGIDESWLDISAMAQTFEEGQEIAQEIRRRIKKEMGVTISVGVSFNKIFAKLGSDMQKPDAVTVISHNEYKKKVWPLPVSDLLFVGRQTTKKLLNYSIQTIGELATANPDLLQSVFGKVGIMLWRFANGYDDSPVSRRALIKTVGNSTTTPKDLVTEQDIKITLYKLSESVAARLREHGYKCSTVQVTLRDKNLFSFERQAKLSFPCADSNELFKVAYRLVMQHKGNAPLRSLGVRGCNLALDEQEQLSFLPEAKQASKHEQAERAIEAIRDRYGHFAIQRGIMLMDKDLSNLDPKTDHVIHPVAFNAG